MSIDRTSPEPIQRATWPANDFGSTPDFAAGARRSADGWGHDGIAVHVPDGVSYRPPDGWSVDSLRPSAIRKRTVVRLTREGAES